jgi:hypothetical protein
MNVLEMHIALRQTVDRVNSLRNDQLRTEEIDLELNRAMMRFINQRYGGNNVYQTGFEESQKRTDELRRLLSVHRAQATFLEEMLDTRLWIDTAVLPQNYMYMVNLTCSIWLDSCRPQVFTLEQLKDIIYFSFSPSVFLNANGQFPALLRLASQSSSDVATVWSPSQTLTTSGYTSAGYPNYMAQVIQDMIDHPGTGFQIAFGYLGDISVPGEVIVAVDTTVYPWMEWDASIGPISVLQTVDSQNNVVSFTSPKVLDRSQLFKRVPSSATSRLTNRMCKRVQQDDILRVTDDPFSRTSYMEPLVTVRENSVDMCTDNTFAVDSVRMLYIRKPTAISLSLNADCELPDHTHDEIIRIAAASILGINEPSYQIGIREKADIE